MPKHILTPRDGPVLAVDPGQKASGLVWLEDDQSLSRFGIFPNDAILHHVTRLSLGRRLVIERMDNQHKVCGDPTNESNVWAGRFLQAAPSAVVRIRRVAVAWHIGGQWAGDKEIRAALIHRYGGKEKAIGNKQSPGPLYGVADHCWQALALALAYRDGVKLADD